MIRTFLAAISTVILIATAHAERITTHSPGIREYIASGSVAKICKGGAQIIQTTDNKLWIYVGFNIFMSDVFSSVKDLAACE